MRCRSHGGLWHLGLEVLFRPPRPLFASACLASCVRCIRQDAGAQLRGEPLERPPSHPGPVALAGECCEGHGDRRSPHGAPQPVAKSLRGAAHRLGLTRVPQPYCRSRRAASATHPDRVLRVLSPGSHASLARQGCAGCQARRAPRGGQNRADSPSRWPASSLRPRGAMTNTRPTSLPPPPPTPPPPLFFFSLPLPPAPPPPSPGRPTSPPAPC